MRRTAYVGHDTYGKVHWRKLNSERDRKAWSDAYTARTGRPPKRIPAKVKEPGEQVFEVVTPVIVEQALWDEANTRLRKRGNYTRSTRPQSPVSGLLR